MLRLDLEKERATRGESELDSMEGVPAQALS